MKTRILALSAALSILAGTAFAGEITLGDTGRFDLTSLTSFGVDLDHPYRYGLNQELLDFSLVLNLVPYQKLSNRVNSPSAVGFVDLTLFHLDLMTVEGMGYNPGIDDDNGEDAYLTRNRFQTGEFVAGIAKGNWIIQMNAGGNEPFFSPWNKGLQYVNDKVKFTWAYMDSMVDVVRTSAVSDLVPQEPVMEQFQQDGTSLADALGMGPVGGATVGLMYNKEDSFGLNFKLATENTYNSDVNSAENVNGLAAGIDYVVTPQSFAGLKVFASVGGTYQYGKDLNADPVMVGTKVSYAIPLSEDISLEPYTGIDFGTTFDDAGGIGEKEFEIAAGTVMRWPGEGGWYTDYFMDDEGRVFPGMAVAYKILGSTGVEAGDYLHDVKFTLFEPKGDEGVFYGIGAEAVVDIANITKEDKTLIASLYLDYTKPGVFSSSGSLIPWVIICYDNLPDGSDRTQAVKIDTGVKLDGFITNTVLGLTWDSGDVLHDDTAYRFGYLKATCEIKY